MRRGMLAVATAVMAVVLATAGPVPSGAVDRAAAPRAAAATTDDGAPLLVGGTGNSLGTGTLLGNGTPFPIEWVTLAVNPYCTSRSNGDRYQSGFIGVVNQPGTCTGPVNPEHRPAGYDYVVDLPPGRTSGVEVWLWDARYSNATVTRPGGGTEAAIDEMRLSGDEPFTFTLLAPDATPSDQTDNPVLCSRTFTATTPFDLSFLGSERWNRLPCAIAPSQPAGRYLVRVQNGGTLTTPVADGSNQFGIVAARTSDGTDPAAVLCDSATDPTCPRVAGSGGHSIRADADTPVVDLPLVEVGDDQQGRRLTIDLFDPGEGGNYIEVLRPATATTWTPATFGWSDDTGAAQSGVSRLSVAGSQFNDRVVRISVDLTGYVPPPGNHRWKVRYNYMAGGSVTDRTTWDVAIADTLPGRITGLVAGATPIDGTTAWLLGTGDAWPRASSTVNTQGRFSFPGLAAGTYQVYLAPPPGSPLLGRWVGGTGVDRAEATGWVVLGDGATIGTRTTTLATGATLSGTVTSAGAPLAGASVKVFGVGEMWLPRAVVTTAPDGTWTLPGAAPGTYEILVQPTTGPAVWAPGVTTRDATTPATVTAGEALTVDVDQAATRAVVGRVTDRAGTAAGGVGVVLYRPGAWLGSRQATSRADGTFAVLDVPDGTYQVRFLPPAGSGLGPTWFGSGIRSASTTVTVAGGATVADVVQALPPG